MRSESACLLRRLEAALPDEAFSVLAAHVGLEDDTDHRKSSPSPFVKPLEFCCESGDFHFAAVMAPLVSAPLANACNA